MIYINNGTYKEYYFVEDLFKDIKKLPLNNKICCNKQGNYISFIIKNDKDIFYYDFRQFYIKSNYEKEIYNKIIEYINLTTEEKIIKNLLE